MLDGQVLGASQVEYKPFGKPPLKREPRRLQSWRSRTPPPRSAAAARPAAGARRAACPRRRAPGPSCAGAAGSRRSPPCRSTRASSARCAAVVGPLADEGLVVGEVLAGRPQAQVGVAVLARSGQLPVRAREQRAGRDGTIRPRASPGAAVRGLRDLPPNLPFFFYGLSFFCSAAHSFRVYLPVKAGKNSFLHGFRHALPGRGAASGVRSRVMPSERFRGGRVLSTVLPHSVRMGTRMLEILDDMREILSYDSIGCKQALPIFEELVKAGHG